MRHKTATTAVASVSNEYDSNINIENNINANGSGVGHGHKSNIGVATKYLALFLIPAFFLLMIFSRHPAVSVSASDNDNYHMIINSSAVGFGASLLRGSNPSNSSSLSSVYNFPLPDWLSFQLPIFGSKRRKPSKSYITWCIPYSCKRLNNHFRAYKRNSTLLRTLYDLQNHSIYSLHRCDGIQMRINVTEDSFLFFNETIKALESRRQLCDFENKLLWDAFYMEKIAGKYFRPKAGFPIYQAYDLLTVTLFSKTILNHTDGMWLEFGVSKARSTNITSMIFAHRNLTNKIEIHGFDTFEGLPTVWKRGNSSYGKGHFHVDGNIPPIRSDIIIHKGLFEDQVPKFLQQQFAVEQKKTTKKPLEIVGMNIDNDLYDGCLYILRQFKSHFRINTILHFHEIYSAKEMENPMDELRALYDFLLETDMALDMLPVRASFPEPVVFVIKAL